MQDFGVTDDKFIDAVSEIRSYVREKVEADKTEIQRLAVQFKNVTAQGTFISVERVELVGKMQSIVRRQPNALLHQYMRTVFRDSLMKE